MNWGKSIIVVFVLFAGFIATLVTVCVRQDVSLVSKEYYKDELKYGEQIERIENAEALPTKPGITIAGGFLVINYDNFREITSGELKLFRPSNEKFDRQFDLSATSTQSFDLTGLPAGMYRVRMKWAIEGKEYFIDEILNL
ncbi:MAG TPA: FixH family protein [Cyclobacteriaceae bacterium]|nr:FixH family protein [Cyclobacteriaceae bacterium]